MTETNLRTDEKDRATKNNKIIILQKIMDQQLRMSYFFLFRFVSWFLGRFSRSIPLAFLCVLVHVVSLTWNKNHDLLRNICDTQKATNTYNNTVLLSRALQQPAHDLRPSSYQWIESTMQAKSFLHMVPTFFSHISYDIVYNLFPALTWRTTLLFHPTIRKRTDWFTITICFWHVKNF